MSYGGVGGNRTLTLTPEPVSRELWLAATADHRNVDLVSLGEVDKLNDPLESLPQRAKQKSPGGPMVAFSSKNSSPREVNQTWSLSTMRSGKVGLLATRRKRRWRSCIVDEELGQIF